MREITGSRILYRIIAPFTALFALVTALSWLVSAFYISNHMESTLKEQMTRVAEVISRSGYILNPGILDNLKQVINGEIVVFDHRGQPVSSTFSIRLGPEVFQNMIAGRDINSPHASMGKELELGGLLYRTVVYPVNIGGDQPSFMTILTPSQQFDNLRNRIVVGMAVIALLGMAVMAPIGYSIARSITAPVEELAMICEKVSNGDFSRRARVFGTNEIGILANSFNEMIEKLLQYEQRLVESHRLAAIGQMAAALAHEVRNPLTSIKMLGQVLHGRLKNQAESQEMLQAMTMEIDRLDRIIQGVLDRSRPNELTVEPEDINAQVEEVLRLAEEGLKNNRISVERRLSESLPAIPLDKEKIRQVLWNLILNAKEAMPKGGRLIVSTSAGGNENIELTVEDSGAGIPGEDPEGPFEAFFTTKPEGMGMGLTISRKIITAHGGSLMLENSPHGGTIARMVLSVRSEPPKPAEEPE